MKSKLFKIVGLAAFFAAFGSACIVGLKAGQSIDMSNSSSVTTKWIGYLVVGRENAVDRIAPGPHPTTVHQVQIGLRSDGVVIWRNISNVK